MRLTLLLALLSTSAAAETFHVTTVRDWTPADAPRSSQVRTYVVEGDDNGVRLVTQQMFTFGSQHFEVGKDYEVKKRTDSRLTVIMHDKKNRDVTEVLSITSQSN